MAGTASFKFYLNFKFNVVKAIISSHNALINQVNSRLRLQVTSHCRLLFLVRPPTNLNLVLQLDYNSSQLGLIQSNPSLNYYFLYTFFLEGYCWVMDFKATASC